MRDMNFAPSLNRRQLILGSAALIGSSFVPAAPALATLSEVRLRDIARRELERHHQHIWLRDSVGIADFSLPSSEPRFFIVNLESGSTKAFFVTHGRGSDPEHDGWLKHFSNTPSSNASSRGAYRTDRWYQGKHGSSMRLSGLDADNSNAEDRAIVVHGARYADPAMIAETGKLGRSEGCFAFPESDLMEILARLGPGRLLFADRL